MTTMVEEVTIERVFNAPRDLVFKAWTDPEQVKQWYGPRSFTVPVAELDLRPGGAVRIDMQTPDGTIFSGGGEVHEVVEPERLVLTTTAFEDENGEPMLAVRNTITFDDMGGKTKLTLHAVVTKATPEMAQALSGMEQGWNEGFEKLEALLSHGSTRGAGTVTSRDGTTIAYERIGQGPPVILIDGALCSRAFGPMEQISEILAADFTAYRYDRRGRNESGDAGEYHPDREVEDIAALIEEAGGSAYLFGISSGAGLAMLAARRLDAVTKVAAYEPPLIDESRDALADDYKERMQAHKDSGRHGEMLEMFMLEAVQQPREAVEGMKQSPFWQALESVAPTLIYDDRIMDEFESPASVVSEINVPLLAGSGSASPEWFQNASKTIVDAAPNATHFTLDGQDHNADANVLAPVVARFFQS